MYANAFSKSGLDLRTWPCVESLLWSISTTMMSWLTLSQLLWCDIAKGRILSQSSYHMSLSATFSLCLASQAKIYSTTASGLFCGIGSIKYLSWRWYKQGSYMRLLRTTHNGRVLVQIPPTQAVKQCWCLPDASTFCFAVDALLSNVSNSLDMLKIKLSYTPLMTGSLNSSDCLA